MTFDLAPIGPIVIRPSASSRGRSHRRALRAIAGTLVRSALIGLGIGVSVVPAHPPGVLGIATLGVLAIGAALASWNS